MRLVTTLLLATTPALAGSLDDLDAVSGWGEVSWGDPAPEGLELTEDRGDIQVYDLDGGHTWGDLAVRDVRLFFDEDRLYRIEWRALGREARSSLHEAYGRSSSQGLGTKEWKGDDVWLYSERSLAGRLDRAVFEWKKLDAPDPTKGTVAWLDVKEGFRGSTWGSAPPEEGLVLVDRDEDSAYYTREGESMKVGQYPLDAVVYAYWRDQLYAVALTTRDEAAATGILEVLREEYGDGETDAENERGDALSQLQSLVGLDRTAETPSEGLVEWNGDVLSLSWEKDGETGRATVVYIHNALDAKRAEAAGEEPETEGPSAAEEL